MDALDAVRQTESTLGVLEERWRAGRAVALAGRLVPGQPCPVCGATDHPAPARADQVEVPDDELAASRSVVERARRAHSEARDATAGAKNDLTAAETAERSIRQEPGARNDLEPSEAAAAVAACLAEVETLSVLTEAGDLEAEQTAADAAAEAARAAAQATAGSSAREEWALAAAEARLAERAAAVPEELRDQSALERAIGEAHNAKNTLDDALAEAQRNSAQAREKRIALQSGAIAAAKAEAEAATYEKSCLDGLAAAIARYGFAGEDDWRQGLRPEQERLRLETEVHAHGNAVQQAKGRLHQAELAVAHLPEPGDLTAVRDWAGAARAAHAASMSRQADARNAVERLAKIQRSLAEIDIRSDDVRRMYETVGVLAEVANGNNSNRVSFQRWVLGVYLDEVLVAASRKLFAMSDGRYRLERQREVASRGRASGLDLAVFDEFSGTSRPAITLSGARASSRRSRWRSAWPRRCRNTRQAFRSKRSSSTRGSAPLTAIRSNWPSMRSWSSSRVGGWSE